MKKIEKKIENLIYNASIHAFSRVIKNKHIETITGIKNIPIKGPYIVVANHSSFTDHFILSAIFHYLYNEKIMYLTKKESFKTWHSRIWHNATGCIPIDREKADVNSIKQIISHIQQGRIIVIYPEGTRGSGEKLLPFKTGAFKIATMLKVPILPISIIDAHKILPKGKKWPFPAKSKIVIHEAISVEEIKELGSEKILKKCEQTINNTIYKKQNSSSITDLSETSKYLAYEAENIIEKTLNDGVSNNNKNELVKALSYSWYGIINDKDNINAHIQYARAYGLKLLNGSKLSFILNAYRIPKFTDNIFKLDNKHAYGKYILGSFYLNVPYILGGSSHKATHFLHQAYINSYKYGIASNTFIISYAKALIKTKQFNVAHEILQVFISENNTTDVRNQKRIKQAEEVLNKIFKAA